MSETTVSSVADLRAEGVRAGYGERTVLHDVDLTISPGRVTTIVGPNGCGKSTLLRTLSRLLDPSAGSVLLAGRPLADVRRRELARTLAVLPQNPVAPEGLTVADLVARGRQPHQPWYRQWSREDEQIIARAMTDTGVADLADRPLDELSGGQRQRAWIAMVLAQQTHLILLDEPTTHLDLAHAVEVLDLVVRLCRETGRTIVTVLHDLNLAARFSDHLVVMDDGRVRVEGSPGIVLDPELLEDVFGLHARVHPDPVDHTPTITPVAHA